MGAKIAMGFHTCVDYELVWDISVIENAIKEFDIKDSELTVDMRPEDERGIWVSAIAYMKNGTGGEIVPEVSPVCVDFANRFIYNITLGGTSTRAALALDKLGIPSVVSCNTFSPDVKRLMPENVKYFSTVGENSDTIGPHVILSYHGGERIQGNDIDFVTPRENRIMISRDIDSLNMRVDPEFASLCGDAEVFLIGSFSQLVDKEILSARMDSLVELLSRLNPDTVVVFEDGCYVVREFRSFVHEKLIKYLDIVSMNEDELQDYIGRKINILDANEVYAAVKEVKEGIGIDTVIVHSSNWAMAMGKLASKMNTALTGANHMAETRFMFGDDITQENLETVRKIDKKTISVPFSKAIMELGGEDFICIPTRDLDFVKNPTVVGLGDSFAGGLMPGLLKECLV